MKRGNAATKILPWIAVVAAAMLFSYMTNVTECREDHVYKEWKVKSNRNYVRSTPRHSQPSSETTDLVDHGSVASHKIESGEVPVVHTEPSSAETSSSGGFFRAMINAIAGGSSLDEAAVKRPPIIYGDADLVGSSYPHSNTPAACRGDEVRRRPAHEVTLVTQLTAERIDSFRTSIRKWGGPVSAVVYSFSPREDLNFFSDLLPSIDVHVVLAHEGQYPVNLLRNVGLNKARTDYVLLLDADFVVNSGAHQHLLESYPAYATALTPRSNVARFDPDGKSAMILPAFQVRQSVTELPDSKAAIVEMMRQNLAIQVPPALDKEINPGTALAHHYTDYGKWMTATDFYDVSFAAQYEPYFAIRKASPRYDTRFIGYGNDKVVQIYELHKDGFRFRVVPDAFVIHIDHPPGDWQRDVGISTFDRIMRAERVFLQDVEVRFSQERAVLETSGKIVVSKLGQSCSDACADHDLVHGINNCIAVRELIPGCKACQRDLHGPDLPGVVALSRRCLTNSAPHSFSCAFSNPENNRLCPCKR